MNTKGKQFVCINAIKPDMSKIKAIKRKLFERALKQFTRRYRDILDLTKVKVQLDVVSALIQFYDPPLRCFTFQDFQLAPTLEEFDRILNFSKENAYVGIEKTIEVKVLAKGLGIPYSDLVQNYRREGPIQEIKRVYLEAKELEFANYKEWEPCVDCLGLLVFGVILFPQTVDYIDPATISIFWGAKVFNTNPTPALLADIYYTLHMMYEKRKGTLNCSIPLLYT